ncbi:MAG: hypothetical protein AAF720_12085 [Pseudomonadota bacterium]
MSQSDVAPKTYLASTADKIAFTVCCMAERMNFALFAYGFLLLAIQAFSQKEADALLMLAGGSALLYIMYFVGGFTAQRLAGEFRAMVIGLGMIPTGNFLIGLAVITQDGTAMNPIAFVGLGMALAGSGFYRVNSVVVVSKVFPEENAARETAFQALFWAESLGMLVAITLAGFLVTVIGWSTMYFIGSGIGILALSVAILALRNHWRDIDRFLKPPHLTKAPSLITMLAIAAGLTFIATLLYSFYQYMGWVLLSAVIFGVSYIIWQFKVAPEPRGQNVSIASLAGVTVALLIFGLFYEQGISALVLFSKSYINLELATPLGQFTIAPNVFIVLTCLVVVLGAPVISAGLLFLEKRNITPSPVLLITIGILINSISVLMLSLPASGSGAPPFSPFWMVGAYVLNAVSELFALPAAFSLAFQSMPESRVNAISGVWFLNFGISNYLGARAAVFVSIDSNGEIPGRDTFSEYFTILGSIGLSVAAAFLLVYVISKQKKRSVS